MYFSNFNKNITYSTVWGGELTVEGQGAVKKEDTNVSPGSLKDLQKYPILRLDNGITSVGPGFLETFGNMQSLIICRSIKSIAMTPALSALLQRNRLPRFQEPILKNQDLNWFLKNL